MFGRSDNSDVNAAKSACSAGRLDEALGLLGSGNLLKHRGSRAIRETLAEAFLRRGQEHMLGRRFAMALTDFDKAQRCGILTEKVHQWQRRARKALRADQHDAAERDAALADARQRCQAGSLSGAAEALADAPVEDTQRAALSQDIDRRRHQAAEALDAARVALQDGDIRRACEKFHAARSLHHSHDGLAELESNLIGFALGQATEHFGCGRPDRARLSLDALGDMGRKHPARLEISEMLQLAEQAAGSFADHDYSRAGMLLGRLKQICPQAGWISEAHKLLEHVEDQRRDLQEGPLGLLAEKLGPHGAQGRGLGRADDLRRLADNETLTSPVKAPGPRPAAALVPPPIQQGADQRVPGLPKRLLLRMDGVGSFLLLRGDRIRIGRAGPAATADLQLISDLSECQAEILRGGEDYFIVSQSGVDLAGQKIDHALLQDGDRIRLGKRMRLIFRRPTLKSTAAVLDLSDGVRCTSECRRVILWSGPVLIGGEKGCHIRIPSGRIRGAGPALAGRGFVLMERGGQMYVKKMGPSGEATPIVIGEPTTLTCRTAGGGGEADMSFCVVDWSDQ